MAQRTTAIANATALAGPTLVPLPDAVVLIEGEIIRAAGPSNVVEVPAGASVIDASGLTLAPGFIDSHVHIALSEPSRVLARGVTSVRDLGWPPQLIFPLVERSRSVRFRGPSIVAAGQVLTAPDGYPTRAPWAPPDTGLEVPEPAAARAAVGRQVDAGATVIKVALNPPVGPTLSREVLHAIVEAAHEKGLEVTGHVFGLAELDKALDAGIDELAHMLMSAEEIPDETLERMSKQGVTVVPTLSIFFGCALRIATDNLRRFLAHGGDVIYGTDLGNEGPRPGIDAREVRGMVAAGMSTLDVIKSATCNAAHRMRLPQTGQIDTGKWADLVAFEGDPLRDEDALTRVAKVWRRGRLV